MSKSGKAQSDQPKPRKIQGWTYRNDCSESSINNPSNPNSSEVLAVDVNVNVVGVDVG